MCSTKLRLLTGTVVLLLAVLAWQVAQAHIFDQYEAATLPDGYGSEGNGTPADHSYGEIVFVGQYPSPDTLSEQEKYMLVGTAAGPSEFSNSGFPSWKDYVIEVAILYWQAQGSLPERMTPEVYAAAYNIPVADVSPVIAEMLKSPITGDYPYLNSESFSPGNLFIKLLTPDEKQHFASDNDFYYECWFNSRVPNSKGGYTNVEFNEPVYYVRVYGWNNVIDNAIRFSFNTPYSGT